MNLGKQLTIRDAIRAALCDLGMPVDDVNLHSRASYERVMRIAAELTGEPRRTIGGRQWHICRLN